MNWDDYLARHTVYYQADKYLCISETTANDLQIYTSIDPDKLVIINGAANDIEHIVPPKELPAGRFIFMPTGNDIRKNNERAIEAFEFHRQEYDNDLQLVISSFFTDTEKETLSRLSPNVIFSGSVSAQEVNWFYENCELVLFPSVYEGLGMPIIEAMHFEKPIAASSIDVFKEITTTGICFFNPYSTESIMKAIEEAISSGYDKDMIAAHREVIQKYTWENTANAVASAAIAGKEKRAYTEKKRIAVVGPVTTGISAIGKVIGELHAETTERFDVDYYYEESWSDIVLRPDILGHCANYYPLYKLTDRKARSYDAVIYHIGNSNHHAITYTRAVKCPSIVVLHDLNIEGVFKALVERNIIDESRSLAEQKFTNSDKTNFTGTLAKGQRRLITHSSYAGNVLKSIGGNPVVTQLPIDTPKYYKKSKSKQFTFGMAGIIAGIKGVETIERIANHPSFVNDRILIFGINFAEPGLLDRVIKLPNVEVTTNLSDYGFQEKLKELDVFVNYRTKYQGEASQATLESMRWGIPVIVRGDFGWYSELPDEAVMKVESEDEAVEALFKLKTDGKLWDSVSSAATAYTVKYATQRQYVDLIEKIVKEAES
jgi:glycosyltransferase involved in cell wall biosynthesis